MAITRRQFVTRLGTLAAAMGVSQIDLARVTQAFAHGGAWDSGAWTDKPKVIWVHGAECTGCSTSLLGLFEDATGVALESNGTLTATALDLAAGGDGDLDALLTNGTQPGHPWAHRTLNHTNFATGTDPDGQKNGAYAVNIADVLIDFISLEYHETVMGMGGDLAYTSLDAARTAMSSPFVLVVEGAVQDHTNGGYWNETGATPWCSIGVDGGIGGTAEHDFGEVIDDLAVQANCAAIVAIGQCATYGGYPACIGPGLFGATGTDSKKSQTGAKGVYDYLVGRGMLAEAGKVINVPGCPTNPWWFVLTVVAWLVDATAALSDPPVAPPLGVLNADLSINGAAVDRDRRLKAVYDFPVHSGRCPRYADYAQGRYARKPGDAGCLLLLGCKGPSTKSLCPRHGWNNQQPQNSTGNLPSHSLQGVLDSTVTGSKAGGYCVTAGAPCMGCTERGYPDAFTPFVTRSA